MPHQQQKQQAQPQQEDQWVQVQGPRMPKMLQLQHPQV